MQDKTIKIWIDTTDPRSRELLNPPASSSTTDPGAKGANGANGTNGREKEVRRMEEVVVPFMGA